MLANLDLSALAHYPLHDKLTWFAAITVFLVAVLWLALHNHYTLKLREFTEKEWAMFRRVAFTRSVGIVVLGLTCIILLISYDMQRRQQEQTQAKLEEAIKRNEANAAALSAVASLPAIDERMMKEALAVYAEDRLDDIKARYEDIFVSYLYLIRCKQIDKNDYTILLQALKNELKHYGIPADPTEAIYSAAQGSYDMLYSDASCEEPILSPVLTGYKEGITRMINIDKQLRLIESQKPQ